MSDYLYFSNVPKSEINAELVAQFSKYASMDDRVMRLSEADDGMFIVEAVELPLGKYSLGRIAGHLHELPSERAERLLIERAPLSDIVNIDEYCDGPLKWPYFINREMPNKTRHCLTKYAHKLGPSSERAQCFRIASYELELQEDGKHETIAHRIIRDHRNVFHAKRQARLMVLAGCANEINRVKNFYGEIIFEDGSSL